MKINSLSASKIKTIKDCEFKFYLAYHLGLELNKNFPAEQGSLVHSIYENHANAIKNKKEPPEWIDALLEGYRGSDGLWTIPVTSKRQRTAYEREKDCGNCEFHSDGKCFINGLLTHNANGQEMFPGCPKARYNDAVWLVEKVLNDPGINNPMNKEIIDVERRFEIEIRDGPDIIKVVGYIDIITEFDKETVEIHDYKTGTHTQSYEECSSDPQLLIYNLAAHREYPHYENYLITIYYLRKQPITLGFGHNDCAKTEKALIHYWHLIKSIESPRRRCDKPGGRTNFDYVCQYMCDIEVCKKQFELFKENGYKILPPKERDERKRKN
jgi:hypothetical protein